MKIVICGSRQSEEIKILRESVLKVELERQPVSLELVDEEEEKKNPQRNAFVYFCDDEPTNQNAYEEDKQQEIFKRIDEADWVIVIAPLNNIGKITYDEICEAREAQKRHPGYPVLTVFKCKDYYDYDESKTTEKGYGITDFGSNISIERLENELGTYLAEYEYDQTLQLIAENKLGDAIRNQLVLNLRWKKFKSQHLMFKSVPGEKVIASDLYSDSRRAGFIKNEYLTRGSVDWNLGNAILNEKQKYIVITGLPGSGKTRAVMEALKPCAVAGNEGYSLGVLSQERVIVVNESNVNEIYHLLQREQELSESTAIADNTLDQKTLYFLIDQIRDVFGMLNNDEDLYKFFDLLDGFPYIKLIATSLRDAFDDLCDRWGIRPIKPLSCAKLIDIPLISEEKAEEKERIRAHFSDYPNAESIGECIPELAKYKEGIVQSVYDNKEYKNEITCLLKSLQTVETFRRGEMALFLPYIIARKLCRNYDEGRMKLAVQYLIKHGLIKSVIDVKDNRVIKMFNDDCFITSISDNDEYDFDGEHYEAPIISTKYRYTLNDIAWKYLAEVDEEKNKETKVLWNYDKPDEIEQSAKSFFVTIPKAKSLKRILLHIPRPPRINKECYDAAIKLLWRYVFEKLKTVDPGADKEYINVAALLVRYSPDLKSVESVLNELLHLNLEAKKPNKNEVKPTHAFIAYLYLAASNNPKIADSVVGICRDLKENYGLDGYSMFSFAREKVFQKWAFNSPDKPCDICRSLHDEKIQFYCEDGTGPYKGFLNYVEACRDQNNEKELFRISESLAVFADSVKCDDEIESFLDLYRESKLKISRKVLKILINKLADFNWNRLADFYPSSDKSDKTDSLIVDTDKEYIFVSVMRKCDYFLDAKDVYDAYYKYFKHDNPKLLSMAMQKVHDHEFQIALNLLDEVETRREKNKEEKLSVIIYNNLLKQAPAIAEAFAVLSRLDRHSITYQTQTLANVLYVIKKRKYKKNGIKLPDPKQFFFAYDVIMRLSKGADNGSVKELWQSSFIIGSLLSLAQSDKHEEFIRKEILDDFKEDEKCKLIDFSTTMSSIRIHKLYRTMKEAWDVFNKCRDYRVNNNLFINSDLYSSMMSRISFSSDEDNEDWAMLRKYIEQDINIKDDIKNSIVRKDDYFYPSWYAYDPVKRNQIFDDRGNLSSKFLEDIQSVPIRSIDVFNRLFESLTANEKYRLDFNHLWKLYEFVFDYYDRRRRPDILRPESTTFKCLFRTVQNADEFIKVKKEADLLLEDDYLKSDSCRKAYLEAAVRVKVKIMSLYMVDEAYDYETCIDKVKKAIDDYKLITPTLFNRELMKIFSLFKGINKQSKNQKLSTKSVQTLYDELKNNLLENEAYGDKLPINVASCISIIKIADEAGSIDDVKKWIEKLKKIPNDQYKYNADYSRELAVMPSIAAYDFRLSSESFDNWKQIMNDICNIPINEQQEMVEVNFWSKYNGYWHVYKSHLWREMEYYNDHNSEMSKDERNNMLKEICSMMDTFNNNNIHVPFRKKNGIDYAIKKEIKNVFGKVYK